MVSIPDLSITDFEDWLNARRRLQGGGSCFSIAVHSPCLVCQPQVANELARYLNEFDVNSDGGSWLAIAKDRLEKIEAAGRELAELLFSHGNLVVEMPTASVCESQRENVFYVYMSCSEPSSGDYHLWLNAKHIDPNTLTRMIAGSFLEWAERDTNWQAPNQ